MPGAFNETVPLGSMWVDQYIRTLKWVTGPNKYAVMSGKILMCFTDGQVTSLTFRDELMYYKFVFFIQDELCQQPTY